MPCDPSGQCLSFEISRTKSSVYLTLRLMLYEITITDIKLHFRWTCWPRLHPWPTWCSSHSQPSIFWPLCWLPLICQLATTCTYIRKGIGFNQYSMPSYHKTEGKYNDYLQLIYRLFYIDEKLKFWYAVCLAVLE